jgi:CheY-like chemotaxis protein
MNCVSESRPRASMGGIAPSGLAEDAPRAVARILLIEDDDAIRESLAEGLRDNGLKVAAAEHGLEALALLRTEPLPSAIVLDLMLPVMDGWDFRHEQLSDPALRDIPVVIITAAGFSAHTIRMQLGDVQVIAKPVRQSDLLDVLNRACARH